LRKWFRLSRLHSWSTRKPKVLVVGVKLAAAGVVVPFLNGKSVCPASLAVVKTVCDVCVALSNH
jgi:hypothetical protein